jgi:hypothetical protein
LPAVKAYLDPNPPPVDVMVVTPAILELTPLAPLFCPTPPAPPAPIVTVIVEPIVTA